MSKFLTPPVWYDGYGTLNDMLTGKSVEEGNVVIGPNAESGANVFSSVVIYGSATGTQSAPTSNAIIAGTNASASSTGVIAIGAGSSATAEGAVSLGFLSNAKTTKSIAIGYSAKTDGLGAGIVAIGSEATASDNNTIAIGSGAKAGAPGCIAIGAGATANTTQNVIQLGNNNTAYTLKIGNNTINPSRVQNFFEGNMDNGVDGNVYVYANFYKSGAPGSSSTGWYQASITNEANALVVRNSGGNIMVTQILLDADPSLENNVATKRYVDNAIAAAKLS